MIKKISAIVLALVLCLSVVVLPASAAGFPGDYTLAEGKSIAYKIELDKASYKAGDTVTVNVYLNVESVDQIHTGSMLFAVNSDLFDITTTNTANNVKATAVGNATYNSFYNDPTGLVWSWQAAAIKTRVQTASTAEENATYNEYLKVVLTRNTSGSHPNAGLNTAGLPGADVNADTDPFLSFKLVLKDSIPDGTAVKVAIVSGAIKSTPAQTAFKVFDNGATTNTSPATSAYDVSQAIGTATVGSAASSILNPLKSQIRFDKNADNTYAGTFAVRQLAVVSKADFENAFGTTVEAQKAAIAEVGYVFARTSTVATFDVAAAKALIENGTAAAGYTKLTVDYITTKADLVGEGNYGFSCIVANIPDADNGDGISALAYIKGNDGTFHYYPAAELTSFNTLYNTYYNRAFPA